MQGFGDLHVSLILVGGEQNAGTGERAGRSNAFVEQTQEFSALTAGEVDKVALEHGSSPPSDPLSLHPLDPPRSSPVAWD